MNDLPAYIYCDIEECGYKHYLSFNKDIQGNWSAGFVAYTDNGEEGVICRNGFITLEEASEWIKKELNEQEDNLFL